MKFITAADAARLVADGHGVIASGSGGGHAVPEALLAALGERFAESGSPSGLTFARAGRLSCPAPHAKDACQRWQGRIERLISGGERRC